MALLYLIILAIVQGITEFLPISSSGHLVLLPSLMGEQDQGLLIDIAVHFGTLLAVCLYFYRDVATLFKGGVASLSGKSNSDTGLFITVLIATLPIIGMGYFLHTNLPQGLRSPELIGWTTLIFGLFLGYADLRFPHNKSVQSLSKAKALIIGLFQILALLPGTSRSGITISACRLFGLKREEASRFALLLGIPTILGAATLGFLDLYALGDLGFSRDALIAIVLSFIFAYIAIAALMRFAKNFNFLVFVIYRVILGSAILLWIYL